MQPLVALRSMSGPAPAGGIPITSLRLHRSLGWPAGQAEATLSVALEPPEPGSLLTITAAPDRETAPAVLFTGRLLQVSRGSTGSRLLLEESTGPLTRLRVDAAFVSTTAAVVIRDLADRAGVRTSLSGIGAQLPFYAVLACRSAMEHIVELGLLSGFRLTTTTAGVLKAAPAVLPGLAAEAFGPDAGPVLGLVARTRDGEPAAPKLTGDGAYTRQGAGAESWLLQDLSAMQTGDGPEVMHLPALKSAADVEAAGAGWRERLSGAFRERTLLLMGPPPADLGDLIRLNGFAAGDGPVRIAGITVLWHTATGLQTRLALHGMV